MKTIWVKMEGFPFLLHTGENIFEDFFKPHDGHNSISNIFHLFWNFKHLRELKSNLRKI